MIAQSTRVGNATRCAHFGRRALGLRAQEATGNKEITVLADRGYFNGDQVLACENTDVLPCVPKTLTSGNAKRGLFTGQDFIYDAEPPRARSSRWPGLAVIAFVWIRVIKPAQPGAKRPCTEGRDDD